jgi:hypothetical protein
VSAEGRGGDAGFGGPLRGRVARLSVHFADPVWRWRAALGLVFGVLVVCLVVWDRPWELSVHTPLRPKEALHLFGWWAAAANALGVLFLMVVCPWWASPPQAVSAPVRPVCAPVPRVFLPVVAAAVVFTAVTGWQRLDQSLWDDEEYTLRRAVLGSYDLDEPLRFKPVDWNTTLSYYKKPGNHVLHSILARVSLHARALLPGMEGRKFTGRAYRLPACLAGIAAVAALAWCLKVFGFPGAGMLAAWMLALHPWYLRYASEARGYSLVLLLLVVAVVVWKRAVGEGRWLWWALLGVLQFAMVATWPAMIYTLVVLNGATLVLMAGRPGSFAPGGSAPRWFVCTALAGMASLQLLLPLVPQMRAYLAAFPFDPMGDFWLHNTLSHFLTGFSWRGISLEHDRLYPCLWTIATARPVLFTAVCAAAPALIAAGLFRFVRRSSMASATAAVFLLPGLLAVAHAFAGRMYLYEWYLIVMLPGLVAFCAVGLAWVAGAVADRSGRRWAGAVPVVLFLAAYLVLVQPLRH